MNIRSKLLTEFYTNACDEDQRLIKDKHSQIEFITTSHYIDKYLKPNDKILEVGAGTGRYSIHYAKKGYDVTSIEFIEHNLNILKSKITDDLKINAEQGDALDLSRFPANFFDVTLVLGPLYHLYEENDIEKAIGEAIRVTKKNGKIIIAYLTSDSIMVDWAINGHLLEGYGKDFDTNFKMNNFPEGLFASFYIKEFKEIMSKFPVKFLNNVATDGMSHHIKERIDILTDKEFKLWVDYHLSTCEREDLQGYSNHMIYICEKL